MNISPNGWRPPTTEYLPDPTTRLPLTTPTAMGHPRDICHAVSSAGDCSTYTGNDKIGNGNWDRATYFSVNYPGFNWQAAMTAAGLSTTPTRYQVYRWEIAHRNDTFVNTSGATVTIGGSRVAEPAGGPNAKSDYNQPVSATGINPLTSGAVDRRTFPVAVINCTANNVHGGSDNVPVLKWMNMFLVEPSYNRARTSQQDVYVEVVSVNDVGNNDGGASSVVRRDKPYLVR
jgi:hypothetical protein